MQQQIINPYQNTAYGLVLLPQGDNKNYLLILGEKVEHMTDKLILITLLSLVTCILK